MSCDGSAAGPTETELAIMIVCGGDDVSADAAPDMSWVVVSLTGSLHAGSTYALRALDDAVSAHPGAHVLVDLSDVTSLDSAAVTVVADAQSRAAASGGVLTLHGASGLADTLLENLGLVAPVCAEWQLSDDVA